MYNLKKNLNKKIGTIFLIFKENNKVILVDVVHIINTKDLIQLPGYV